MIGDEFVDAPQAELAERRHKQMGMDVDKSRGGKFRLDGAEDLMWSKSRLAATGGGGILDNCGTHDNCYDNSADAENRPDRLDDRGSGAWADSPTRATQ